MMAAVLFKWPQFQFPKQMLPPVSTQSLQGWRKLEPPRSRLPLRWEAVCLMAEHMMGHDMVEEALMMLLAFVMYLRPGEVCKLRCQDLVPPVGQGRREASKWSLVLHPQEELVPSKTAEFEETLLFDLPYTKFVAISVHQWRRTSSRPGHQLIFSKTASQLREAMVSVAQKYALQPLGDPHPYRSRHGGASRDFATGDRKQPDNTTPGSLEDSRINKEVREGGTPGATHAKLVSKGARRGLQGCGKNRKNGPMPALSVGKSLAFLEVFSGTGRLGSAASQETGWPTLLWDIRLHLTTGVRLLNGSDVVTFWVFIWAHPVKAFHGPGMCLLAHPLFGATANHWAYPI